MMSAQSFLDSVTRQVTHLISCDTALLVLDCPVHELRHPLLTLFPSSIPEPIRFYGAGNLVALLHDEEVRASCDMACQSSAVQYLLPLLESDHEIPQPVAIVPVSGPAGVLGYFLLTGRADFTEGEDALLREYVRDILQEVERAVRALLLSSVIQASSSQAGAQQNKVEQHHWLEALDSISIVSHELRAPLAAIKGYAGLLQAYSVEDARQEASPASRETILTPAHQQHYLDMIMDETRHLEELMADLLDASRVQSGKLTLHFSTVDIGEACQRAAGRARQHIDQLSQIRPRLECVVAAHLPPVRVDINRLQQILNNLLDNAIKYSPRGGNIELRVDAIPAEDNRHAGPRAVSIVVRDQGIGIPAEHHTRLFQPFSRLVHSEAGLTPAGVQGVGLGLYITRRLVEAMHGTIAISSREGEGTEVTVHFPVEQRDLVDYVSLSVIQTGMR